MYVCRCGTAVTGRYRVYTIWAQERVLHVATRETTCVLPPARRPLRSCSDSIAIAFGMSEPEELEYECVLEDNNDDLNDVMA